MLVGTKYGSTPLEPRYDVIVVGSGMGGLTAAALLSNAGKKVLVLERHYTAGGFTHSYRRRGFEWDVGVHYVGDVHKPASPLRRVLDAISDGQLEWAPMDEVYDRVIIGDDSYDFVAGAAKFREELVRSFPGAGSQIDSYLRLIRAASGSAAAYFAPRLLPGMVQPLAHGVATRITGDYFTRTTASVLSDVVTDPRLAGVLTAQWGDYGVPPARSSFGMHAMVSQHYLGGASFPVGGAWRIASTIVPVIERSGGAVMVNAEVDTILLRQDRAVGVRLASGEEVLSDQVISAVGLPNTYTRLIPEEAIRRQDVTEKLSRLRPAASHIGLYVGLDGTAEDLGLGTTNLWLYRDYDHDASLARYMSAPTTDLAMNYISFPSAKDPTWESRHPGTSTIDAISLAPYEWFETWKETPWRKRGAEYDEFKQQLAERMLDDVYKHVPQVRGKVAYHELSTPLSTSEFVNHPRGEIYGLEHTPERFAQKWIRPSTPLRGLYVTGQDVLFCGVGGALMSGVMTAGAVLGPSAVRWLPEAAGLR